MSGLDGDDIENGNELEDMVDESETDRSGNFEDPEIEAIRARVREMEEEAEKLKQLQTEVTKQMQLGSPPGGSNALNLSLEEKVEVDNRSVFVGNVDYGATAEELEVHFNGCGAVNRVTILCNKYDGHPKGFAYIEFADKESVQTAMALDDSLFRGRQIKVILKRTNRPGWSTSHRMPRMRGRGRGMTRGGMGGTFYSGFRPTRRPRGTYRKPGYYMPYYL